MKSSMYVILIALISGLTQARLVFPPGSDIGYIVSDEPEQAKFYEVNEIDGIPYEEPPEHLLQRGERNAMDIIENALLRTLDGVRDPELNVLERNMREPVGELINNWKGKWFPHSPQVVNEAQARLTGAAANLPENMTDDKHGVKMGIKNIQCDDGKLNLTVDWDESSVNYTCFDPKHHRIPVRKDLKSLENCYNIPKGYVPQHFCMDTEIIYNSTIPTYGNHRPIWPAYGEYRFAPPQRWLHNIEHGGVVMLYHPCTEPILVHELRKILRSCYRKHVITPYTPLTRERPLALVAWGCSLEMATVDVTEVRSFIKARALHGPEGHHPKDGGFTAGLIRRAEYPIGSDGKDENVCPK